MFRLKRLIKTTFALHKIIGDSELTLKLNVNRQAKTEVFMTLNTCSGHSQFSNEIRWVS